MSKTLSSFLDLKSLSVEKFESVFSLANQFEHSQTMTFEEFIGQSVALLFFEASTRTRISFELSAHRLGLSTVLLDAGMKTSLEKGETLEDSVLNVCAMKPAGVVVRCGDPLDLRALTQQTAVPLLNAGWGLQGHPSQALLDLYTIQLKRGALPGTKILFVGDIRHSRVVASHREVAEKLGIEVRFCTPTYFLPEGPHPKNFEDLHEAASWADVIYCLRSQFERHGSEVPLADGDEVRKYREFYMIRPAHLEKLSKKGLLMHPGPIHRGLDIEDETLRDPRNMILDQVKNGVQIRQAILFQTLRGELANG